MWTAIALLAAHGAILGLYAWWAFSRIAAGASGWPFVAALPLACVAAPFVLVVIWFALGWCFGAARPSTSRLSWRAKAGLFLREFLTVVGNAPRMIFYRLLMPDPPPGPHGMPILLVHGVLCNAGVWYPFARWLSRRGIGPVYAISYGPPLASIELFAEQVHDRIETILAATGPGQVMVIAHSMGGLVMRTYLRNHGGAKIARLVTVGTPHEGSALAWLAFGACMGQMRPGNAWLGGLGSPGGDALPPIVSLWSWHDTMVYPQTSSRAAYAENVELTGIGHNALLTDRRVFERLATEIGRARGASPNATSGFPA